MQLNAAAPSQKVTIMMGAPSDRVCSSKVTLPQTLVKPPAPAPTTNFITISDTASQSTDTLI